MKTQSTSSGGSTRIIAIIVMFFVYAMISFVTNLAAPIGTIWGHHFEGNNVLGMMGNMMNFLAYLFMGIPAGNLLVKIGYKKTTLAALVVGVIGLFIQYISGRVGDGVVVGTLGSMTVHLNYIIYLLGAFVCGFCVCMLNTVCCPMLNLLGGGGNKGNQLLQSAGAFNSLAGTLTPLLVGVLIGQLTKETSMIEVSPLLIIGMAIFVVAGVIVYMVQIPEPGNNNSNVKKVAYTHSPWNFRHTVLGVIAIFFYVGIEVGIPGTLNFYRADQTARGAGVIGDASAIAGAIVAIYWLLMLVGRSLSAVISSVVSTRAQLLTVSSVAIVLIVISICIPKEVTIPVPEALYSGGATVPVSAMLLIFCGLCTSIMWGSIFNLAVEGLGKYTAQASGIFMMMVVGGGLMPLLQNYIADLEGYMTSYWLVVAMLAYIFFYALAGSKNVNTDIPVLEEDTIDPRSL